MLPFFSRCASDLLQTRAGGPLSWAYGHYKSLAVLVTHIHAFLFYIYALCLLAVYVRQEVLLGFKISHPAVKNLCLLLTRTAFLWCHWLSPHPRRLPNSASVLVKRLFWCPKQHFFLSHNSKHFDWCWCQLFTSWLMCLFKRVVVKVTSTLKPASDSRWSQLSSLQVENQI